MNKAKYLIAFFVFLVPVLCIMLTWNCHRMYGYERKRVHDEIEYAIAAAADTEQWQNVHLLNNIAHGIADPNYNDKVTFAAGFTHNMGELSVVFADTNIGPAQPPPPPPQKHRSIGDTPFVFTKKYFKDNKVAYKPELTMTIKQFDPLFKRILARQHMAIPYVVCRATKNDKVPKGYFISAPFIVDFYNPTVYCLHYSIPTWIPLRNITPYIASSSLLAIVMILGTVFFYRSYRLQQQQYQFRESLFGNITHELKTPLTSMQLIIDDAKKHISGNDTVSIPARHVQFADDELSRMNLIVENILSFSKMGQKQFVFNQELVDLDKVIKEAIRAMKIKVSNANGLITYEPDNNIKIHGNPALLTNMLTALIDNALKYTERAPVIDISLQGSSDNATISVKDNGTGIPPAYIKKVFEPFFRIPAGNLYKVAGHGLGLSFVKQVVNLHSGRLSINSNNFGTTFDLTFINSGHL